LRVRFNNDPAAFLEFVHNPANHDEMGKLGLLENYVPKVQDLNSQSSSGSDSVESQP